MPSSLLDELGPVPIASGFVVVRVLSRVSCRDGCRIARGGSDARAAQAALRLALVAAWWRRTISADRAHAPDRTHAPDRRELTTSAATGTEAPEPTSRAFATKTTSAADRSSAALAARTSSATFAALAARTTSAAFATLAACTTSAAFAAFTNRAAESAFAFLARAVCSRWRRSCAACVGPGLQLA
jgi:hypothetical protein